MKKLVFVMITILSTVGFAVETDELNEAGFAVGSSVFSEKPLNASLTCKVFNHGYPQGELSIDIKGNKAVKKSLEIRTSRRQYRAELIWDGLYGDIPKNPEARILSLDRDGNVDVESYKNVDLQRIEKSNDGFEADNIGVRNADDAIYLSCTYEKKN